ncbi:hypothetical protein [Paenibacillus ehimensis]|uniref:hypothetical protein n=1 Tax=Paenibacillus ehimensis TaxID=79264 RepID=UPI000FDC72E3|nr:hypothetical protein [Paenibacillus ehimensis]
MKILKKVCMISALACLTFAVPVSAAEGNVPASFADKKLETSNNFSTASDPSGSYILKPWETKKFIGLYPGGDNPIRFEVKQQGLFGGVPFLNYKLYMNKDGNDVLIKDYSVGGNGFNSDSFGTERTYYRLEITNVMYYSGTSDVKIDIQFYEVE